MLTGVLGFCFDRYLPSDHGRVYLILGSALIFGLGVLLWYFPLFERFPLSISSPNVLPTLPPRVRLSTSSQPPAVSSDVPPATAPPLPGLNGGSDMAFAATGGSDALQPGVAVLLNGGGPTALLQGQRGVVLMRGHDGYEVVLHNGMKLSALPADALTVIPG